MRRIILDTDMGNDVDDVLALAVLHSLHQKGRIILDSILVSKDAEKAPIFTELFGLKCGSPVPVAKADRGIAIPFETYLHLTGIFLERDPKTKVKLSKEYPAASTLLKERLEAAEDKSIDLLTIGFLSNIGDFLKDEANVALFNQKVARIFMMAGNYEKKQPEFNVMMDIPSFKLTLEKFDGPVTFVGFELGRVRYPETSIRRLYEEGVHEMLWLSYFSYADRPHHRQTWDPLTALVASGCFEDSFGLSKPGEVTVEGNGVTVHKPQEDGRHRFVTLTGPQETTLKKAMVSLIENLGLPVI
ncbi:MAG: nucleoside hydrolase [Alphaproteobacteria bacterium]